MTRETESVIPEQFDNVIELGVDISEKFMYGFLCHNYEVVKRGIFPKEYN